MCASTPNTAADCEGSATTVHVAVGVLLRDDGRVLIARRHADSHQGGLWEFPGGKVEQEEPVFTALCREFGEELGVSVESAFPLTRVFHDYGDKSVLLDVWQIGRHTGVPYGREGQEIRWHPVASLQPGDFPAANAAIVRVLQLPAEIAITPALQSRAEWLELLAHYRRSGVSAVQLHQRQLGPDDYRGWFEAALESPFARDLLLFFNHPQAPFSVAEGAALHVTGDRLAGLPARPVPSGTLLSVSCHDLVQLQAAERLGADLALLSPVATGSGDGGRTPLGWDGFRALTGQVSLPVYALGGLKRGDRELARANGAAGIAGVSDYLIKP